MDGWITIGTKLDTKKFDEQITQVERRVNEIEKELSANKEVGFLSDREVTDLNVELEKTKNKLVQLRQQKEKFEQTKGIDNLGSSFQSLIKKASRLTLGIFGIRSAYMAMRRASSELASYDPQYAANLEYIRFVLTQSIAPVLKGIVNLAGTLLGYVYAILDGWFGIGAKLNISAEAFNKMKKGAGGVSKSVKEIKKQLAGFDEINMLNSQSDTGVGVAGGSAITMPDFGEKPEWLETLGPILAGIVAAIFAMKLGLEGIKALGIGLLVTGIIYAVQGLIDYLNDPSWNNFGKMIKGIGIAIAGLGLIIGGPAGLTVAIAGAITFIAGTLAKHWEDIKSGFDKAIEFITGLGDKAWKWFWDNLENIKKQVGLVGAGIIAVFIEVFRYITELVSGAIKVIRNVLDGLFRGAKQVVDGIIQLFRGDLSGIVSILKGIVNMIIGVINGLIAGINAIAYPIRALIAGIGKVLGKSWTVESVSIPTIPYVKTGAIVNMPNRGTYVGGAMAGESGREGFIPLTDSQAMAELGREIGKNVLINLTNVTSMNGRVIGRELKQINAQQDFAYNT